MEYGLSILKEKSVLVPQITQRIYDSKLQYYKNDVALIDWNSAFIIEPSGSMDIPDVAGQKYIEIAEIVETVENSLKVIGDLYHSVVFRTASSKFRFTDWQSSIDNKLDNLADICKLLLDNINHRRSYILELIVISLISLELIPLIEHMQKFFGK